MKKLLTSAPIFFFTCSIFLSACFLDGDNFCVSMYQCANGERLNVCCSMVGQGDCAYVIGDQSFPYDLDNVEEVAAEAVDYCLGTSSSNADFSSKVEQLVNVAEDLFYSAE